MGARVKRTWQAVLCASALTLAGCGGPPGEASVALGRAVRSASSGEVDLAKVWSRPWDELYVFGPYSLREDSCRVLGLDRLTCLATIPGYVGDHEYLLVLRHEATITLVERHRRIDGDFYNREVPMPRPVPRANAVFAVKAVPAMGGSPAWYRLEHKTQVTQR